MGGAWAKALGLRYDAAERCSESSVAYSDPHRHSVNEVMTNNAMHPLIAIPVFCIYLPSSSGLLGRWEHLGAGEDVGVQRVVALADQPMTTAHSQNSITHVGVSDTGTESGRVSMSTIGSARIVDIPCG